MIVQNPPRTIRRGTGVHPQPGLNGHARSSSESPPPAPSPRKARRTSRGCGAREVAVAFLWAMIITLPILALGGWRIYGEWAAREQSYHAAQQAALAHENLLAAPAGATLPADVAALGRDHFATTCAACHGQDATGVTGLGRDLTTSDFVALNSDSELRAFLAAGRADVAPPMPPRGGNPDLTDGDLDAIVVYMRGLQDPRRMPDLAEMVIVEAETTEEEAASDLALAGGDAELAEYIASGRKLFATNCASCHGRDARGLTGLGVDLVDSAFRRSLDDEALHAFIKRGRQPSDPDSLTGIAMPPKGGNPALSDDDMWDIIDYLTSIDPESDFEDVQ